jgi:hypothetical protein
MGGNMSVQPGELDAGSGRILGLVDTAQSMATGIEQSLSQMASAIGLPDLAGGLAQVTDAATKAMLDTAAVLGFVGQNLKQTASNYDKTESTNTKNLQNAQPPK